MLKRNLLILSTIILTLFAFIYISAEKKEVLAAKICSEDSSVKHIDYSQVVPEAESEDVYYITSGCAGLF